MKKNLTIALGLSLLTVGCLCSKGAAPRAEVPPPATDSNTVSAMDAAVSRARGALQGVNFETGTAELTEGSKTVLNDVATTLTAFPNVQVEVQGHTDATGSVETNTTLSQLRAESVVNYLTSVGVDGNRLTAKGYGPTVPVAENSTTTGRQQNRRVELKWVE